MLSVSAGSRGSGFVACEIAGVRIVTVSDGFHPPVEEYLEAIFGLTEEDVPVIQARLVERLGYSPQAVSEMVGRLTSDGYLVRAGRGVSFSDKGHETAVRVVRRHRLAERFLVDIVGLPWHKAHEEAGRWEHVISDDVEARFIEMLGKPTTCPHGSPIPGLGGRLGPQVALSEIAPGIRVHLARVTEKIETDWAALVYLGDNGVVPGRDATVRDRGPDGTITLVLEPTATMSGATVALGSALTRHLFVDAEPAGVVD